MKRNEKRLTTRIIGGKYKGKKIELPDIGVTRSSKSRLKESFFNTLQFDLVGSNFIEMFGGSGSIGLEALSRGAKRVWFAELDRDAYKTLTKNCQSLDASRCDIRQGDAFTIVPLILESLKNEGEKCYLYIDPPFSIREGHEKIYEKVIDFIATVDPAVIHAVVVEHMSSYPFPEEIGPFERKKYKKFGKSSLSYYFPK
jgi:16S rRNA (guanine966-N2)-methyltransferase